MSKTNISKYNFEDPEVQSKIRKFAERIQPIYDLLNWKWSTKLDSSDVHVPAVEEIHERINDLIESTFKSEHNTGSRGGFKVELYRDHDDLIPMDFDLTVSFTDCITIELWVIR